MEEAHSSFPLHHSHQLRSRVPELSQQLSSQCHMVQEFQPHLASSSKYTLLSGLRYRRSISCLDCVLNTNSSCPSWLKRRAFLHECQPVSGSCWRWATLSSKRQSDYDGCPSVTQSLHCGHSLRHRDQQQLTLRILSCWRDSLIATCALMQVYSCGCISGLYTSRWLMNYVP